jgi:hypothetical protein
MFLESKSKACMPYLDSPLIGVGIWRFEARSLTRRA